VHERGGDARRRAVAVGDAALKLQCDISGLIKR
jgi:hypothetical protein